MMRQVILACMLALLVVAVACAKDTGITVNKTIEDNLSGETPPPSMPALNSSREYDSRNPGSEASNGTGPREPRDKEYVSKDPEQCKVIRYACAQGKRPFSDAEGCGCETDPTQDPDNLTGNTTSAASADPTKHYAIRDPQACKSALFKCSANQTAFFDENGCGCQDLPRGNGSITFTYQPMQCQQEPWQEWYAQGKIKFIKAPTDEELIIAYFGSEHKIEVKNVKRLQSDMMTCQACDVCPKGYSFTLEAGPEVAQQLIALGWKR